MYHLTTRGREALAAWLQSAPTPPGFGSEILLRIAFADSGHKDALLNSIASCREQVSQQYLAGRDRITEQLDGSAPYFERANLNVLWWVLIGEQLRLTLAWLDWAESEVQSWDGTRPHGLDAKVRSLAEQIAPGLPVPLELQEQRRRRRPCGATVNGWP